MKSYLILLPLLLLGFALSAQNRENELDTDLAPFENIKILGNFDVTLILGEQERIEIETEGLAADRINVAQQGKTLKVSALRSLTDDDIEVDIKIYYRSINSLSIGAGARIEAEVPIEAEEFFLRGGSGAEAYLEFKVSEMDIVANEGAHLTIKGDVNKLSASANTGGIFDGHRLKSQNARLRAGTGGEVSAQVSGDLDAKANTGGVIRYAGDPDQLTTKTILGGEIRPL